MWYCRANEIAVTQGAATEDEVKVEKAKAYADLEAANNSGFTDKLAAKVDSIKTTRVGSWISKTTIFRKLAYGSTYQVQSDVSCLIVAKVRSQHHLFLRFFFYIGAVRKKSQVLKREIYCCTGA